MIASTVAFRCLWWKITLAHNDINKPMLCLIGLIIATSSWKQRKITTQDRHLCWRPYFLLDPAVAPHFLILESPLFDGVNYSKSTFITTENHHAWDNYVCPPTFSLAPQWPPSLFIPGSLLVPQVQVLYCEGFAWVGTVFPKTGGMDFNGEKFSKYICLKLWIPLRFSCLCQRFVVR